MYLPPLQPLNRVDNSQLGDVIIHPSAAIAPGVLIQATPDSRIIIDAGVCIGMGAILNAYGGTIEIKNGAVIGAGVLIIGSGIIGERACIGTTTTIFNADVKPMAVISAGTVIGDTSRQISSSLDGEEINGYSPDLKSTEIPLPDRETNTITDTETSESLEVENAIEESEIAIEEPTLKEAEDLEVEDNSKQAEVTEKQENTAIFGKLYVNQLLVTLFPQGQNLNSPPPEQK